MKEEKTKSKKKVIYYLIVAVCALLLIAATVLTVYFVTAGSKNVVEKPPVTDPSDPGDDPSDPNDPSGSEPTPPTGGDAVTFVSPIDCETVDAQFGDIFCNQTMHGWYYHHQGIDFTAPAGTEVKAVAAGKVSYIGPHENLGNLIIVDHDDGVKSYYYFCEPVTGLAVGASVTQGMKIAEVAEAYGFEAFLGPHLHFEMYLEDDLVDPADYFDPVLGEK